MLSAFICIGENREVSVDKITYLSSLQGKCNENLNTNIGDSINYIAIIQIYKEEK